MTKSLPRIAVVIPARLDSQRLPAKALLEIRGLPMVEHVRRRTNMNRFGLQSVVVSGDDIILNETKKNGGKSFKSQTEHLNGLSRIGEYGRLHDYDFYIIVQGDEILLLPRHLDALISEIVKNPEIHMINCVTPIIEESEIKDESIVKCIRNSGNEIIFIFRKSPLTGSVEQQISNMSKINGLFAISRKALELATTSVKQPIETIESIEQMKLIELGLKVHSVLLDKTYPSINLQKDVALVQQTLDSDQEQKALLESILS